MRGRSRGLVPSKPCLPLGTLRLAMRREGERERHLWSRSGTHGNRWHEAWATLHHPQDSSAKYQVRPGARQRWAGQGPRQLTPRCPPAAVRGPPGRVPRHHGAGRRDCAARALLGPQALLLRGLGLRLLHWGPGPLDTPDQCHGPGGPGPPCRPHHRDGSGCRQGVGQRRGVGVGSWGAGAGQGGVRQADAGTPPGHYMVVDMSPQALPRGHVASLISEEHRPLAQAACLTFWYHLSLRNPGEGLPGAGPVGPSGPCWRPLGSRPCR